MSYKLCMVGCGDFATYFHGPAQVKFAALHPTVELTACCDILESRAASYKNTFGFRAHYTDLVAMLEREKPDAVTLAVPERITFEAASTILARSLPLLLEKPPGLTTAELARMAELAAKHRVINQVGFNRRFIPAVRRAVEILQNDFPAETITQINYDMIRFNRLNEDFSTTAIHGLDTLLVLSRSGYQSATFSYGTRSAPLTSSIVMEAVSTTGIPLRLNIQPGAGRVSERASIHGLGQTLEIEIRGSGWPEPPAQLQHWRGNRLISSCSDSALEPVEYLGALPQMHSFYLAVSSGRAASPSLSECATQVALMQALRQRQTGPLVFR